MPDEKSITQETIAHAEKIVGLSFTESERELMLDDVNEQQPITRRCDPFRSITPFRPLLLSIHACPAWSLIGNASNRDSAA